MKKTVILLFIFMFFNTINQAQSLKLGFRIEPGVLITEQSNKINVYPVFFCLYGNAILEPTDWLGFEVRPGYLLSYNYGGFEIGTFARLKIFSTKFFLIGGINNHSNSIIDSHNGGGGYYKQMLFKAIGLGFHKDSKLSFDIIYYWTNNKDFEYSRQTDFLTYYRIVNTQMNGIIKIAFNLSWEILKF